MQIAGKQLDLPVAIVFSVAMVCVCYLMATGKITTAVFVSLAGMLFQTFTGPAVKSAPGASAVLDQIQSGESSKGDTPK
jgi:hypothetical protein